MFKRPKDKPDKESTTGVVYKIKCNDCNKIYIGQTNRALKIRIKEHKRAVSRDDKTSLVAMQQRQIITSISTMLK